MTRHRHRRHIVTITAAAGEVMSSVLGLRIPACSDLPVHPLSCDAADPYGLFSVVGSRIEVVHQADPPATYWLHRDGAMLGLPVNNRATALLHAFSKFRARQPHLRGEVLLTGHPNHTGVATNAPAELHALLLHARSFTVEVQVTGSDAWTSNGMLFTDWFSAATFVIDLGLRWPEVAGTRIARKCQRDSDCRSDQPETFS
jgi:hypothetical protein